MRGGPVYAAEKRSRENTPNTSLSSVIFTVRFSNIRQFVIHTCFVIPAKYYKNIKCYFGM
ncbi:MAG: hypothetical protein XU11_C0001G0006 [Candidatus Dadabacteria bacterium CSP1-2]|nr:MAG: hypothetical protein XU11_C0001G0006 [Candidatus Dadabacteria bacterium CSP1-2]